MLALVLTKFDTLKLGASSNIGESAYYSLWNLVRWFESEYRTSN